MGDRPFIALGVLPVMRPPFGGPGGASDRADHRRRWGYSPTNMAAHTIRNDLQRAAIRAEIARRYKDGETQTAIGIALDLSQQQISYYLKQLYQEWRSSAPQDLGARLTQELAKIDLLEAEAQAEYERSKRPIKKHQVVTEAAKAEKDADQPPGEIVRTTESTEGRVGDPRFLERVSWCIDTRLKIWGLYAATKQDTAIAFTAPPIREVLVSLKREGGDAQ